MTSTTAGQLDYIAAGSWPGVVVLHGTGADAAASWQALIDSSSDRYTVVAPNLPGAGASPVMAEPLELDELAGQVLETARAAGLGRFHLVGHSIGAVIATAVAIRTPDAIASLLLHAGWVKTGAREAFQFDGWARLLRAGPELLARHLILTAMSRRTLAGLDQEQLTQLADSFTAMLDERILPQIELDLRIDLRDKVTRVTAPTLVLASAEDQIIPPHHQQELADSISGARYQEVPGGHGLPFEDPPRFSGLITQFIDAQQAAATAGAPA